MAITFFDPNAQAHASQNMWQNLLGNMILQKISQNFREKEFNLQREQHEKDQLMQLQAEGWTETPEIPVGGPTEENAQAVKATPSVSVAGKTLYAPKEPKTYDLGNGMVGYLSGGKWKIQQKAKEAAPKFVTTSQGVMRWDEDTGRLVPTGAMPYQAPRQASPYEGLDKTVVHEVDDQGEPIPGTETIVPFRRGQTVKLEGNLRHGSIPPKKDRETGELTESGALQQITNMASGDPETVAKLTDNFYSNMKTPDGKRRKPSDALIETTKTHQTMQLQQAVDVTHKKYPTPGDIKEAVQAGKLDKQTAAYTILRYHSDALGQH